MKLYKNYLKNRHTRAKLKKENWTRIRIKDGEVVGKVFGFVPRPKRDVNCLDIRDAFKQLGDYQED